MKNTWKYVHIGDVCVVERGGSPRPIDKFITDSEDGINWIKIGDTDESMYITKTAQKIIPDGMKKSRYVEAGDFLLSNSMSFGRPYILKIDGCIHDGWLVLRDKDNKFDKRFLYYYLSAPTTYDKFKSMAVGGVVNNLNSDMVRNVLIPLPTMDEQKEIADIFDKITKLINDTKKTLDKFDELIKSRFIELFGDPVENPYGWKQTTLKEIGIGKLSYGSGASACEYDGNIRYVRITDIDNSGNLNDDVVSPNLVDEKYILNDGDILFARSGATVGKSYRYRESDGKCLYAGYLIRLVPNTELVLPDYVFYYTKTSYYERFIESNMKVVAQPNINAQQYGDLTICIPPMELQKDFLDFVEQTDKSKYQCEFTSELEVAA